MDNDISNWQNLWKEEKSTPIDVNKLIRRLNKIEKKGKLERIILLLAAPLTIIFLATLLPIFSNIYYLIFVILIGIGMIMILIQSYRSKYSFINNDIELNNHRYIKSLINKLKQRMLTTSRYMWFYTFLLISGLNIGYITVLQNLNLSIRITIHILLTMVLLWFMYYLIKKRKKENNNEVAPLIDFLENLN